jgi:hypothetical protein
VLDCELELETDHFKFKVSRCCVDKNCVYHWFFLQKKHFYQESKQFNSREFTSLIARDPMNSCKEALDDFYNWYSKCNDKIDSNFYLLFKTIFGYE